MATIMIKQYPVFELAEPNMRYFITGGYGSGKTTATWYLALGMTGSESRFKRIIKFNPAMVSKDMRKRMQVIVAFSTSNMVCLYRKFFSEVFETFSDFKAAAEGIWYGGGNIPGTERPRRRAIVLDRRQDMSSIEKCVFCLEVPVKLAEAWNNIEAGVRKPLFRP